MSAPTKPSQTDAVPVPPTPRRSGRRAFKKTWNWDGEKLGEGVIGSAIGILPLSF